MHVYCCLCPHWVCDRMRPAPAPCPDSYETLFLVTRHETICLCKIHFHIFFHNKCHWQKKYYNSSSCFRLLLLLTSDVCLIFHNSCLISLQGLFGLHAIYTLRQTNTQWRRNRMHTLYVGVITNINIQVIPHKDIQCCRQAGRQLVDKKSQTVTDKYAFLI